MSKEKQIDEIAKLICTYPQCIHYNSIGECANAECKTVDIAENLYKQGYRKQSEVVKAIADFMYDGEVEGLAISMGGVFLTKNEFINKFAARK